MNTDPIFLPINTPIKQTKNVITPIDTQIGIISMFKKAKVTPTANASMLVAIDKIINSFSIVGLMVVGSMAATRVAVDTPLAIKVGEGVTKIQTVLNSLAPGLIPLGITMLVWWMLRKKVNTLWIIVAIFVVGIIGYYTGILGYVG